MGATLAEIVVAAFVLVMFFRLGVELTPWITDWWARWNAPPDHEKERDNNDKQE